MPEPLFPIRSAAHEAPGRVFLIEPFRFQGAWVFDDPRVGLVREPFVAGIDTMLDRVTRGIAGADKGFRLKFADHPFDGHQLCLSWVREDPVEGNWYRTEDGGEGWLCPALFCYFSKAPPLIYLRAEPMAGEPAA